MGARDGVAGFGRVTVFGMFGVVFGYATHSLDARGLGEVAVVGPLTPGVRWERLWEMARNMNREAARQDEHAAWITAQASRAYICGSGRIVQLREGEWKLTPGGRGVRFAGTYCNRDELWTGELAVDGVTPEQKAARPSRYRA